MQASRRKLIIGVFVLVACLGVGVGVWHYEKTRVPTFPINPTDQIVSWNFKGAYTGEEALIARAESDILHLKDLLGTGEYDDYDLYIGIGNDANLLGEGERAYQNYNKAISIHPTKGLAFVNLAHLMDQLSAYHTAADAYAEAVAVQGEMMEYHIERLHFLTGRFPDDTQTVQAAFTEAADQFGYAVPLLTIEAQWLAGQKRYAEAIEALENSKMLLSGKDTSAIDAEIARLRVKK